MAASMHQLIPAQYPQAKLPDSSLLSPDSAQQTHYLPIFSHLGFLACPLDCAAPCLGNCAPPFTAPTPAGLLSSVSCTASPVRTCDCTCRAAAGPSCCSTSSRSTRPSGADLHPKCTCAAGTRPAAYIVWVASFKICTSRASSQ